MAPGPTCLGSNPSSAFWELCDLGQVTPALRALSFSSVMRHVLVAQLALTLCNPMPAGLLCPWDFPGKKTGVGCHFLPQGIFLTQGSNPHFLHWEVDSLVLSHEGSPGKSSPNLTTMNRSFKPPRLPLPPSPRGDSPFLTFQAQDSGLVLSCSQDCRLSDPCSFFCTLYHFIWTEHWDFFLF